MAISLAYSLRRYGKMINELLSAESDASDNEKRGRKKDRPKKEATEKEAHIREVYREFSRHQINEMDLVEKLSIYTSNDKLFLRKWM